MADNIEEKYKGLFELLEKRDSEKFKDKCLLVKKSICRNLKLFLELSEENKELIEFIKKNYYQCEDCIGNPNHRTYLEGKCGGWCSHYEVKLLLEKVQG